MELDSFGPSSKGKPPGAKEHLKRFLIKSPVSPVGMFQTEIGVHFFKATFDTSIRLLQSFFGKWN